MCTCTSYLHRISLIRVGVLCVGDSRSAPSHQAEEPLWKSSGQCLWVVVTIDAEPKVTLCLCSPKFPVAVVTLRNVVELLEFSEAYGADQLKKSCLQFICVNAACFLEGRWVCVGCVGWCMLWSLSPPLSCFLVFVDIWIILKTHFWMSCPQPTYPWCVDVFMYMCAFHSLSYYSSDGWHL